MDCKRTEFSLNQKIFIVKSFYRNNENLARVRVEFQKKFNVYAGDSIFRCLTTVLRNFETSGSVQEKVHFDVIEKNSHYLCPQKSSDEFPECSSESDVDSGISAVPEVILKVEVAPDTTCSQNTDDLDPLADFCEPVSFPPLQLSEDESPVSTPDPSKAMPAPPAKKPRRDPSIGDFHCEECGMGFPSKAAVVVHMRKHTGERPFACEICDKSFKQKGALKVHMRLHTGETPYFCLICLKGFKQNINLVCHMKSFHPGSEDPNSSSSSSK